MVVAMRKMKDSGIEWVGQIPDEWNVTPFRAYVKERTERNIFNQTDELLALSYALGVTLYKDKVFNKDRVKDNFEEYKVVHQNDLVLSPNDIIKGSIFVSKYYGCISPMYYIFEPRYRDTHDLNYLSYLLRTKEAGLRFFYIARGLIGTILDNGKYVTRRMTVSRQDLLSFKVLLPPYDEQIKIVSFLNSKCTEIDTLSEKIQSEIDILEMYRNSFITEAITKGLDRNAPMKDSGMPWIGKVPNHWLIEKVKYHLTRREPKNQGDKRVLSVYREYGVIPKDSRDDNHNVTSEDTSKYKYVRPGNLVINKMKAWQGSMGVSEYEGIVSPAYFIYYFTDDLLIPKYIHYLFRCCYKDEFRRISGGIREGQWDLNPNEFNNTMLLIPPKEEQQEIISIIEEKTTEIEEIIAKKKEQLEVLTDYKKSIIYEYVTGKKEVDG